MHLDLPKVTRAVGVLENSLIMHVTSCENHTSQCEDIKELKYDVGKDVNQPHLLKRCCHQSQKQKRELTLDLHACPAQICSPVYPIHPGVRKK